MFSTTDVIIAPSILSADFAHLGRDTAAVLEAGADWVHVDVMDNHFVPNLTIGPPVVASLRRSLPNAFFDVHLMVSDPLSLVPALAGKADLVCFHLEAVANPIEVVNTIHNLGMKAGLAIKPKTQVSEITDELLALLDMVLVMTVEPGFGGQKYMPDCAQKCTTIRQRAPHVAIQVDGGIAEETIHNAHEAGANVFVAGSAIFNKPDWKVAIEKLREHA